MAGPTLTERVEDLRADLTELKELMIREEVTNRFSHQANSVKIVDLSFAIEKLTDKLAILEVKLTELQGRSAALEKSNDRTWQIAPMVISAVAVLISLLVAFLKK